MTTGSKVMPGDGAWPTIEFDKEKTQRLRKKYESTDEAIFEFEGHSLLRAYAKYMLEYLEARFVQD